ncbi:MAG: ATP-dependent DNA ligase [Fimbriimonadaceae bacterium]|nr:ATP-dependent DNA ligase [Fimbriimonadaceae bacterium]
MRDFVELVRGLDATGSTREKRRLVAEFFRTASAEDSAWAFFLLSGRRRKGFKRAVLRRAAQAESGIPDWLYDACYEQVGDSAELISLLLEDSHASADRPESLAEWIEGAWSAWDAAEDDEARTALLPTLWSGLTREERFVANKLFTGAFRIGVSHDLVVQAAAEALDVPPAQVARHSMGDWEPSAAFWQSLSAAEAEDPSRPYPFCLAHPLAQAEDLGDPADWLAEWKWDGIRCQAVRRAGQTWLWSRGEELLNESFPDVAAWADGLPDGTVLDGEILVWREGRPAPFTELQKRIGRRKPGRKVLADHPCRLLPFDLLEWEGCDLRESPLSDRRRLLLALTGGEASPEVAIQGPDHLDCLREEARRHGAEGLMLKRRDSAYVGGRKTGLWWKWKATPFTVDAVLVYAQRGTGRRAGLYTDYTFARWRGEELVPFAKAYSGLTDAEIREVDRVIVATTREQFGPVRTVEPTLVMELAFEGIQPSTRHKSGLAVRFPRILRLRPDKTPAEADRVERVLELLDRSRE